MDNKEISKILRNVAVAYTIKDENKYRFQIIAYRNASEAIETMTTQIKDAVTDGSLAGIPGIGTSIRSHLEELIKTGKVEQFAKLMEDLPQAMFPLLDIPSFGPKKAYKLVTHFKLSEPKTVIKDVEALAKSHAIGKLEGFGEKSETLILHAIEEFHLGKSKGDRMTLPYANELAEKIMDYLKKSPEVKEVFPLGSLRRKRETIGDIDLAVVADDFEAVLDHFVKYPYAERVLQRGKNEANFLTSGSVRVDLRVQKKEGFGSLLQHFTGSKNHNVSLREYALKKGLSLSEYGIKKVDDPDGTIKTYDTEEKFYEALGLAWIPPEIRENTDELELAKKNSLPKLIELKDMKGDFHVHSNFPCEESHDAGTDSMETHLSKALELGYEYIGFSEHNPSIANHTDEDIITLIKKRQAHIEKLRNTNKNVRIFSLLETDIQPNGSLALPEKALEILDATLVSIHSSFGMDKEKMTKRILKGLSHPKAKIMAHPTARLINQRPSIDANWDEIMEYCKEHHKALEINAAPQRLDLPDELVREAVKRNIPLFISTDSHAVGSMDLMRYGVSVARRGWATKENILNTWSTKKLEEWFKK